MHKKIIITQSNYIPWKGYFDAINMADEFIIYDDMQYTKNDWRNRNKIKTPSGLQWITIPVKQESLHQKIRETKVSQSNWAEKHWKTLIGNYSRAPFFKDYKQFFEEFYFESSEYLSEINLSAIKLVNKVLGIKSKISTSMDYKLIDGRNERLVDLILQAGGTEYLSGPAAKSYIDENLFREAGIEITWLNYSAYPEYHQLYPPYDHGVSIVDLIFNEGPDANKYMKSFYAKNND